MKKVSFFLALLVLGWFSLPYPFRLEDVHYSREVYDRNGNLLRLSLSQDEKYRLKVKIKDVPKSLIETILLQEDQYFYSHMGFNPISLVRAAWATGVRKNRMGGSTLSMQVARLRLELNTKSYFGKIRQIIAAFLLERHYSKEQILEAYLNLAPFGGNIEGIGAASLIYFRKEPKALTDLECLTLTVIPQRPVTFSINTIDDKSRLLAQRKRLWKRWGAGRPDLKKLEQQLELPFEFDTTKTLPFLAPHFVDHVLKQNDNSRIDTSLDLRIQRILEKRISMWLENRKRDGLRNASAILLNYQDMEVRAMVGSVDFFDSEIQGQVNGTTAKRSPGSTLKPFIYGLSLDQGLIHPLTVIKDAPLQFAEFDPENFDHDFIGPISAKAALIKSRNVPAVYLASKLNKPSLYEFLAKTGIQFPQSEKYYGLALALGGAEVSMLELARLYAMLGNRGHLRELVFNLRQPSPEGPQLLSTEASYLVRNILSENPMPSAENYFRFKKLGFPISWKTGTSYGFRDAWTLGLFGPYVLGVWVGNFDGAPDNQLVGREAAAPLFFEIAEALKASFPVTAPIENFPIGLSRVKVCPVSGKIPGAHCHKNVTTLFIPGKSPIETCDVHRAVWINTKSNLRSCQPGTPFTKEEIFEFWPSDLLKLFRKAGLPRREPPLFEAGCNPERDRSIGRAPEITSPRAGLTYQVRAKDIDNQTLPFAAIADADAHTLHWFLDGTYLGGVKPSEALFWKATPGTYRVRVVDDNGRASASLLHIGVAP